MSYVKITILNFYNAAMFLDAEEIWEYEFLMYKACQSIAVSNPIRQEENEYHEYDGNQYLHY